MALGPRMACPVTGQALLGMDTPFPPRPGGASTARMFTTTSASAQGGNSPVVHL